MCVGDLKERLPAWWSRHPQSAVHKLGRTRLRRGTDASRRTRRVADTTCMYVCAYICTTRPRTQPCSPAGVHALYVHNMYTCLICIYMYTCLICIYMHTYTCIYLETERNHVSSRRTCLICIYMYTCLICIYMYTHGALSEIGLFGHINMSLVTHINRSLRCTRMLR